MTNIEVDIQYNDWDDFKRIPAIIKKSMHVIGREGRGIMIQKIKELAKNPRGGLESSVTHKVTGKQVQIYPQLVYGRALNYGLPPSPGRYVPAIGKRLTGTVRGYPVGTWPGFRGLKYMEATAEELENRIPFIVNEVFKQELAK